MLNAIIVDDEKVIADGLKYIIDWEDCGFSVDYVCYDGTDALQYIKGHRPDVVLTDIKMTSMDGLELIRNVRHMGLDTCFIILSGYGEFELVKEAMKNGVSDYLMKPVEEEKLIESLERVREDILNRKRTSERMILYGIRELLNGNEIDENIMQSILEMFKTTEKFACVRFIFENILQKEREPDFEEELSKAYEILTECYSENIRYCVHLDGEGMYTLIFPYEKTGTFSDIYKFVCRLRDHLAEHTGFNVSALVGDFVDSIEDIYDSADSLTPLKTLQFYGRGNKVYTKDSVNEYHGIEGEKSYLKGMEQIGEYLKSGTLSEALVRFYLSGSLVEIIKKAGLSNNTDALLVLEDYMRSINCKCATFDMLCSVCEDFSKRIKEIQAQENNKHKMGIISDVLDYIESADLRDIDMTSVAKRFYISAMYFGRLFKEKTGLTFNQYINGIRIEKSKELLRDTDMRIYEIAMNVGYKNSNYFCMKFEELAGMSPMQYRKNEW